METETIASRNVVDQLLREQFNSSICGYSTSDPDVLYNDTQSHPNDFVYGWDC